MAKIQKLSKKSKKTETGTIKRKINHKMKVVMAGESWMSTKKLGGESWMST